MPSINNPAQVASLQIAGRVFTDITNLKTLVCWIDGAASGNATATKAETVAAGGYVVPAGKQFRVLAWRFHINVAVGGRIQLLYSDNDVGSGGSGTAFTNAKYQGGGSSTAGGIVTIALGIIEYPTNFVVPTGKYVGVSNFTSVAAGSIQLFGYEEAV